MANDGPLAISQFQVVTGHPTIDKVTALENVPHGGQNVLYVLDQSQNTLWRRALPGGKWERVLKGGE